MMITQCRGSIRTQSEVGSFEWLLSASSIDFDDVHGGEIDAGLETGKVGKRLHSHMGPESILP